MCASCWNTPSQTDSALRWVHLTEVFTQNWSPTPGDGLKNVSLQEEAQQGAVAGEDQCHTSAYNSLLTQSPNEYTVSCQTDGRLLENPYLPGAVYFMFIPFTGEQLSISLPLRLSDRMCGWDGHCLLTWAGIGYMDNGLQQNVECFITWFWFISLQAGHSRTPWWRDGGTR